MKNSNEKRKASSTSFFMMVQEVVVVVVAYQLGRMCFTFFPLFIRGLTFLDHPRPREQLSFFEKEPKTHTKTTWAKKKAPRHIFIRKERSGRLTDRGFTPNVPIPLYNLDHIK